MNLYAENILDHARHPHHKCTLDHATVERKEVNASCGDRLTIQLRMEHGRIVDVGWQGDGCAISQASMSLLSDELVGKTTEEAQQLRATDILALLGVDVGRRRLKCALLALHTLHNALRLQRGEPEQSWRETLEDAERIL